MAHSHPWTWTKESRLPSVRGASHAFLAELLCVLEQHQWTAREIFGIHLAIEEALVNAIRHGNQSDKAKHVHVSCKLSPQRLLVEITDQGAGFNPALVPDCCDPANLERTGGRGIMLMRSYMSKVEYTDGGHRVVMEKERVIAG